MIDRGSASGIEARGADDARHFGEMIRTERNEEGLRQEDLARATGVGRRYVVELEAGRPILRIGPALIIAKSLRELFRQVSCGCHGKLGSAGSPKTAPLYSSPSALFAEPCATRNSGRSACRRDWSREALTGSSCPDRSGSSVAMLGAVKTEWEGLRWMSALPHRAPEDPLRLGPGRQGFRRGRYRSEPVMEMHPVGFVRF